MKIYFDTEFTGLHQFTTLISIGIISDNNKTFYAEFNDYDKNQIDEWLNDNIIFNLKFNNIDKYYGEYKSSTGFDIEMKGNSKDIKEELINWLNQFNETIEIWSDCLSYDWVLFNNLFGTALDIPENIYYIPFDICTLFKINDIDPDISREEFIKNSIKGDKHNSLYDAKVIKECYNKLSNINKY